jgi:hypothetical protein
MLTLQEKLHNTFVITLEENIRLQQRLFTQEQDEVRKKLIQDLLALLNTRLEQEKTYQS